MQNAQTITATARAAIEVHMYAVGGTALDITRSINAGNCLRVEEGMEHTTLTLVDTSDSNVAGANTNDIFRFPGLQGGGKNRRYIAEKTQPHISALLDRHKPKKVNLVIFGAGGASGAAVGPQLVAELMKRGQNVVCLVVGSACGSITEIDNTAQTLQTLANFTRLYRTPLSVFYRQNDQTNSIGAVDESIRRAIHAMCLLFSNLNHGIEETDLTNFLNYTKTPRGTELNPSLMSFDFFTGNEGVPDHVQVISQATLSVPKDDQVEAFDIAHEGVFYRCTGYVSDSYARHYNDKLPLNFLLMRGDMAVRLNNLTSEVNRLKQMQAMQTEAIEDIPVSGDGDGFVFD